MSTSVATVRDNLIRMEPEFAPLLPAHVTPKQFTRVVLTAVQNTPALLNADQSSFFSACMKAAEDGLVPDGKQAALVCFGNNVAYMRMISGLIEKLYETGHVQNVECRKVMEGDLFEWTQGTDEFVKHMRTLGKADRPIIAVYTTIAMAGGVKSIHVMESAEINRIRDQYAKSPENSPWATAWEQMAYKTCLRQHCKTKPLQAKFEKLFADHDQFFEVQPPIQTVQSSAPDGVAAAKDILGDQP